MSAQPASSRTPLLPRDIRQAHRLSPHPLHFPSGSSKPGVVEASDRLQSSHTSDAEAEWQRARANLVPINKDGLPKLSRECLRSEIQCYGKYIVATLLVFGLGGIMIAFLIVGRR
jgi:hypothetical protein